MPLLALHSKASAKGKGRAHSVHARVELFSNATGSACAGPLHDRLLRFVSRFL
jgi:hypothetical protein